MQRADHCSKAQGSVATVAVSSGTWATTGNLVVGSDGSGTLTMNGGLVTVGGTLSRGAAGTIGLNAGGTLQIGVGGATGVLGIATLTNSGTLAPASGSRIGARIASDSSSTRRTAS